MQTKMRVFSIFFSISGEIGIFPQGTPVVFIRLAGCNLKCNYCDTAKSQPVDSGTEMTIAKILDEAGKFKCENVVLTGGEPLSQEGTANLLRALRAFGFSVSVETNGSIGIQPFFDEADGWVIDFKLWSSGVGDKMSLVNFFDPIIQASHSVYHKFVCCSEADVKSAAKFIKRNMLLCHNRPALSAAAPLTPAELWTAMQANGLNDCVLNLQIHKYIWPDSEIER